MSAAISSYDTPKSLLQEKNGDQNKERQFGQRHEEHAHL